MKKRLVSFALAALLLVTVPLSAFATSKFNTSVLDGRDDIIVESDDMTGQVTVRSAFDCNDPLLIPVPSSDAVITVRPAIFLSDSTDLFYLGFDYLGFDWAGLNGIIIKIGDNRYSFSDCYTFHSVDDGYASESISFYMKRETLDFMKDLADHQDEEISVRLTGSHKKIDFVLTDSAKDILLNMYDLYIAGGGTRESNTYKITDFDSVYVTKNGKKVIGNVLPIVMYALSQTL